MSIRPGAVHTKDELFEVFLAGFKSSGEGGNGETLEDSRDREKDLDYLRYRFDRWLASQVAVHEGSAADVIKVLSDHAEGKRIFAEDGDGKQIQRDFRQLVDSLSTLVASRDPARWTVVVDDERIQISAVVPA